METKFDLSHHILKLLLSEPFFASLSVRIDKIATDNIPTAGVRINDKTHWFELFYNPSFMEKLPSNQKLGVLKHEFFHLVLNHLTNRMPTKNKKELKVWNIATDLAINSHLYDELPEIACFPEKGDFKDYPRFKSSEFYFSKLLQDEKFMNNIEKFQTFDDHEGWESDEEISEIVKEKLKEKIKKIVAQNGNNWGTLPQQYQDHIYEFMQSKLDWRNILRWFIKATQKGDKYSTPCRINKRYPHIHPGKNVKRHAKIAIVIDQSGSISDNLLQLFFSELNTLSKIATFTVIPHDSQVVEKEIFEWKIGKKNKSKRVSCGGTDFNPPTQWINDHNFDGAIFLTDLQAPKPIRSKCKRMWMTDKENSTRPYFSTNERIIVIDK